MEEAAGIFEAHRDLLMGIAYRMLGSFSDAEDMVQETWVRWSRVEAGSVASPRSWLVTVASRLSLDRLKSAQRQRETYVGVWLPEPYPEERRGWKDGDGEVDESVSIALMLVLEKLAPQERTGFLLHDVFGLSFEEIGVILEKTPATCRKMVSRARERVREGKARFTATRSDHEALLSRFLEACRAGEMTPLLEILHASAELHADGGGKAITAPNVLDDPMVIAKFFVRIAREAQPSNAFRETRFVFFNGVPGVLIFAEGRLVTALALEVREGRIYRIFAHRNPDKLRVLEAK